MRALPAVFAAGLLFCAGAAQAHVTVKPVEAAIGATQTYTARVPTEGTSPTVSLELAVPADVTIVSVKGDPGSYELKQADGRVVLVRWKLDIPPGKSNELEFVAKNPTQGAEIIWKFSQGFADGNKAAWIELPGSRRPAPITKLTAAPK